MDYTGERGTGIPVTQMTGVQVGTHAQPIYTSSIPPVQWNPISHEQAFVYSSPLQGMGVKRTLGEISPDDSSQTDPKRLLQNTPPGVTLNDSIHHAISSPMFVKHLVQVLVQPVANMVATAIQKALLDDIRPQIQQEITHMMSSDKDMQDIITQCIEKSSFENLDSIIVDKTQVMVDGLEHKLTLRDTEIKALQVKIAHLETIQNEQQDTIEEQEQYSRRTCLKFLNVPVPSGQNNFTFDPLSAVLGICDRLLHIQVPANTISRCHILGQIRENKVTVIVRFVRYYDRMRVFEANSQLKGNSNGTMIVEALTKKRQIIVNELNKLRHNGKIDTFRTRDGKIFMKKTKASTKVQISSLNDITNEVSDYVYQPKPTERAQQTV